MLFEFKLKLPKSNIGLMNVAFGTEINAINGHDSGAVSTDIYSS